MTKQQSLWQRLTYDKNGHSTLTQAPNLPLKVWIGTWLADLLISHPTWLAHLIANLSFGAIFTWAWLEIFQGDSLFRRLLGLFIMVVILYNRI